LRPLALWVEHGTINPVMEDAMTSFDQSGLPAEIPAAAHRPVRIYAVIVALLGLDLLLLPAWIAPLAFVDPLVAVMLEIAWLLRGLGLSCLALGAVLWLLARSSAAGVAPLLAFAAGASTLVLLGIGWGHLTLAGEAALLLAAATDIGCGLWMRRALRGQD
jgi:hypothetical protein